MNRLFRQGGWLLPKRHEKQHALKGRYLLRKYMITLILFLCICSTVGLSVWGVQKAHAATAKEIYPAPTTLYTVPVPANVASNWSTPYAITVGPDKNLWFTDYFDNLIGRSTPSGGITEYLLSSGGDPTAIAAGPDGNLWFIERYGGAYGRITPSGTITEFAGGPYGVDPDSLVAGPDGNLWAADDQGWIARITPAGTITDFPGAGINPSTITVGPDGNLWYTAISVIGKMSTAGVNTSFPLNSGYSFPGGIMKGPDGNLWFTEQGGSQGAIARITPNGVITDFPLPTVTYPDRTTWGVQASDLAVGPDGNLWFTANSESLFGQITPGGTITYYLPANASSFGGTSPNSLVAGPDGNLWFADFGGHVGYLALGGSSSTPTPVPPTPTPVPPTPTPTPTRPSPAEFLLASNAAYGLDPNTFTLPAGMKELKRSVTISDGFASIALLDGNNNIIIANEGSLAFKTSTNRFIWNSGGADTVVYKDQTPAALKDAINFAGSIVRQYYGQPGFGGIYVTGHSLGGIEAEAEAKAWGNIAGGATFGATGLPGNTTSGGPPGLINYVDYGDPIGNYASDSNTQLHDRTAGFMYHYGVVQFIGLPLNAANLQTAALTEKTQLDPYLGNVAGTVKTARNWAMLELTLGENLKTATDWHMIKNYASDLQIQLPPSPGDDALASENIIGLTFDEELGNAGLTNLSQTNEQANGIVTATDTTIQTNLQTNQITLLENANVQESWGTVAKGGNLTFTIDPTLDTITSVTYTSPDGSHYVLHFAASANSKTGYVASIQVNPIQGGSYQVIYDTSGSQLWFSRVLIYSQPNEKGTLLEAIDNWRAGGSQVQLFTGLPRGKKVEIENYSGPNQTGKLLGPPQYK
jgi:streptogramin lyase